MAEGLEQDGITNWRNIVGDHRRDAHRMNITGALWTCERGHELDANPSDVMKAAGMKPMLVRRVFYTGPPVMHLYGGESDYMGKAYAACGPLFSTSEVLQSFDMVPEKSRCGECASKGVTHDRLGRRQSK